MENKTLVLVTGASGFLGSHCVKQLLEAGYQVRGTVRSLSNELKVNPIKDLDKEGRLELVEADLTVAADWNETVEGCKYVLHVASPLPKVGTANALTVSTAFDGTLNVLRAAAVSTSVDRIVLTSSASTICDPELSVDGKVFTEEDWADADTIQDIYSRSKVLAERAAWDFVAGNIGRKFDLVVINPTLITGPLLCKAESTSVQIIRGPLDSHLPFTADGIPLACCDVRDVALAHLNAMTAVDAANHRHLMAVQPSYSILQLHTDFAAEFRPMGYKVPTRKAPYALLWLTSWFDKKVAVALRHLGKELRIDNTRMKEVLGIPSPIDHKTSTVEMAYSIIELGIVKKTPGYKPRNC